jgi:hypothetical protein
VRRRKLTCFTGNPAHKPGSPQGWAVTDMMSAVGGAPLRCFDQWLLLDPQATDCVRKLQVNRDRLALCCDGLGRRWAVFDMTL